MRFWQTISIIIVVAACSDQKSVRVSRSGIAALSMTKVTSFSPMIAKPGETVQVSGEKFLESVEYFAVFNTEGAKRVKLKVIDAKTASFVMPSGLGLGERKFVVKSGDVEMGSMAIIAGDSSLFYFSGEPSDICSSMSFFDKYGKTKQGTKDCATATLADCTTDGQTGCRTTASFKAADMSLATAANIKSGATVAGQAGAYPSASHPLPGASSTADLDTATFDAKVKSSTAFEYWDSSGTRQIGSGDSDIVDNNIKDTISIFGTTGNYTGGTSVNAWDLRVGVTVGAITGKLKTSCRNSANLTYFDQAESPKSATVDSGTETITVTSHGWSDNQTVRLYYTSQPTGLNDTTTYFIRNSAANTVQLSTTSGGAAIDITGDGSSVYLYRWGDTVVQDWDTVDDYYGFSTSFPVAWNASQNLCGGIETVTDDANVWKDVTTTGDGVTASTCAATSVHCSFRDKISGLEWHKADATTRHWAQAYTFCSSLNNSGTNLPYNGKTGWRLPTQKELLGAYHNGIITTAGATNWITLANLRQSYWSASSQSTSVSNAWNVPLASGNTGNNSKTNTNPVICARP